MTLSFHRAAHVNGRSAWFCWRPRAFYIPRTSLNSWDLTAFWLFFYVTLEGEE